MVKKDLDPFGARTRIETGTGEAVIYSLQTLEKEGLTTLSRLPYSIKIMLESALRNCDDVIITREEVSRLAAWSAGNKSASECPFMPARVLLQDFTGVPALVDLAAMRSAMVRLGGDPSRIEPCIPSELVIDHSVQVDRFGDAEALQQNMKIEFERNVERYRFLKWGQNAFQTFTVVPPGAGIVHQVNLEYFARGVFLSGDGVAYPDSLVGTDSHTTMINGLGIVGWGVGGIEAEAVMLGQPISMQMPEVIGFRLHGALPEGATATDLVLRVTEILRRKGVVGKFVEFCGPGLSRLSLPDRATIANMAPEYGATMGLFPIDEETLSYLRATGRPDALVQRVERYCKTQDMFGSDGNDPDYTDVLELDLSSVEPSLAGPKRPQDRLTLGSMKGAFAGALNRPLNEGGFGLDPEAAGRSVEIELEGGERTELRHGAVVIAAITSCTNTSNPSVMLASGLLARNAVQRGLSVPPWVKTSLAPGSRVVSEYLHETGLSRPLDQLGFQTVGYGCTTCIGNSGPLLPPVAEAIKNGDLVVAAVLSGNRNFEGRINPLTRANYLASPPLVVAYALAGRVDIDLATEPLGYDRNGGPVYLRDLWPATEEIDRYNERAISPETYRRIYKELDAYNPQWTELEVEAGALYNWQQESSYIQEPPFFLDLRPEPGPIEPIINARILALLGDSVTTDHISPAGAIPQESPAAQYLSELGIEPADFNTYGSRRGNDRIMVRGTFGNIRLKNRLVPGREGGLTLLLPEKVQMWIYDAAMRYRERGVPLIVLAGAEYGTGSSRDWAAKGTHLLGVRAVIAKSFERIHRSNLIGMGVLPLQFEEGGSIESNGLTGHELYTIPTEEDLQPRGKLDVTVEEPSGERRTLPVVVRLDTPAELKTFRHGGILQKVLRELLTS